MAQYKNKRKRRRKLAKKRRFTLQTKAKAGDILKYIQHLNPKNKRHQQYFFQIVARESTEAQKSHLIQQLERMHCFADVFNLTILPKDFRVVASLLQLDKFEFEISERLKVFGKSQYGWLADIAGRMWPLKTYFPDTKFALLFESTCRVVRSDDYTKENKDAPITEKKLKEVVETAHFPIFTICPPDAHPSEVASYMKKLDFVLKEHKKLLGIEYGKYPGWTIDRRKEKQGKVIELRKAGLDKPGNKNSYGNIAKQLDLPIELVRSWCRKAEIDGLL